jgi:hypothetical protein
MLTALQRLPFTLAQLQPREEEKNTQRQCRDRFPSFSGALELASLLACESGTHCERLKAVSFLSPHLVLSSFLPLFPFLRRHFQQADTHMASTTTLCTLSTPSLISPNPPLTSPTSLLPLNSDSYSPLSSLSQHSHPPPRPSQLYSHAPYTTTQVSALSKVVVEEGTVEDLISEGDGRRCVTVEGWVVQLRL